MSGIDPMTRCMLGETFHYSSDTAMAYRRCIPLPADVNQLL